MGQRVDSPFINRHPAGSPFGRDTEGIPLVAAGYFCLEGFPFGISPPQEGVPGCTGFILPNEHRVVVLCALIEDPRPEAGGQHLPVNAPSGEIGDDPPVVRRWGWQRKGLFLPPGRRDRTLRGDFPAQHFHCFHKPGPFHMDKVVEGAFPADIPAFPVPKAGFPVDLEAVVGPKLIFIPGSALHQLSRPVFLQELDGAHLLGGGNLLLADIGHHITASRKSFTRSVLSQGNPALPKWP